MKIVRFMLAVLGLLIVVCAVVFIGVYVLVDPNKLKAALIEEAKKQTGYQIKAPSTLTWSFYPRLGITVPLMTVSFPGQTTPFANIHGLTISTGFMQLLQSDHTFKANVHMDNLAINHSQLQHVKLKLTRDQNKIEVSHITASLYGGKLRGAVRGQTSPSVWRWGWSFDADQVQVGPWLADMTQVSEANAILTGTGSIQLRGSTSGFRPEERLQNLTGTIIFQVREGTIKGADLNYLVQSAQALMAKGPLPVPTGLAETVFKRLEGAALLMGDQAKVTHLLLNCPTFKVNGTGTLNLREQLVDLQLHITPMDDAPAKWDVPVSITGSFAHPEAHLDNEQVSQILRHFGLDQIKKHIQKDVNALFPEKATGTLPRVLGP